MEFNKAAILFHEEFAKLLQEWTISEIALKTKLDQPLIKVLHESNLIVRKPGTMLIGFTSEIIREMSLEMIKKIFPSYKPESSEDPLTYEVELKKNENPGVSLRMLLSAIRLMKRKLEENPRILKYINEGYDEPKYKEVKISRIVPTFIYMDDGLFIIPSYFFIEGGGAWQMHWPEEEIQELRILIQA